MRAVDALMECLKAEGVDVVFGLPGGANLPTYDAFYDAGIRHILVRHEAGGGHAAEGYAKATGKVGVSLGTSGPGATNLVTPICDAMMDSVPVVFITGQVRTELLGTDGFQEADTIGITMPIVKHSFMIQHPLEIPRSIHEAFHIARTGRPGPVVVDIPQDLSRADIPYEPVSDVHLPGYQPTTEGNQKQIRLAAKALANARRPVIYAGGGVSPPNAAAELTELATADRFPVTCTVMGLGAFPAPHDQWLGMLGMHGTRTANYAMDEADLICAVGARFDDRDHRQAVGVRAAGEVHPHRRRSGRDLEERPGAHPDRRRREEHPAAADRRVPRARRPSRRGSRSGGRGSARGRSATRSRYEDSTDSEIKPQYMIQALYEATGGDAIVTSDVGQHQMWTAQYYHFAKPRRWINSGGLGHDGLRAAGGDGREGRLPRSDGRVHRRRRLGPDEHAGARDVRPGGHRDQGVHHEQRLPRAWSASGRSCSGTSATARSTWASGPTSSSSPRLTARPGSGFEDKTHARRRHAGGDRHRRARCSSTSASRARRTRTR